MICAITPFLMAHRWRKPICAAIKRCLRKSDKILLRKSIPTLRPSRSSQSRRIAMWSNFHLY